MRKVFNLGNTQSHPVTMTDDWKKTKPCWNHLARGISGADRTEKEAIWTYRCAETRDSGEYRTMNSAIFKLTKAYGKSSAEGWPKPKENFEGKRTQLLVWRSRQTEEEAVEKFELFDRWMKTVRSK